MRASHSLIPASRELAQDLEIEHSVVAPLAARCNRRVLVYARGDVDILRGLVRKADAADGLHHRVEAAP